VRCRADGHRDDQFDPDPAGFPVFGSSVRPIAYLEFADAKGVLQKKALEGGRWRHKRLRGSILDFLVTY
jgi:hypothetical protein